MFFSHCIHVWVELEVKATSSSAAQQQPVTRLQPFTVHALVSFYFCNALALFLIVSDVWVCWSKVTSSPSADAMVSICAHYFVFAFALLLLCNWICVGVLLAERRKTIDGSRTSSSRRIGKLCFCFCFRYVFVLFFSLSDWICVRVCVLWRSLLLLLFSFY